MNFRLTLVIGLALVTTQIHAQEKGGKRVELKTTREKASYSIGMLIGGNFKKQGVDFDFELMMQGLRDATSKTGKPLLSDEDANAAMQAFDKEIAAKQMQESKDFLLTNKKKPGVKTTASGLQYKVLKPGKGPKPRPDDNVVVVYRGTFPNGTEFDSTNGKPFTIAVKDVIPGWQEALQLMEVGSKWQLVIPSELAYGEQGGPPPVGPNATLVFDLELQQIAKAGAAPQN